MKLVLSAVVGILVMVGIVVGGMFFTYSNREVQLRNLAIAQERANANIFDKVWKVISQKAQVTDKYSKDFASVYTKIMDARYSGKDKVLFNWIKEHNPNFDSAIYNNLLDTIQGQREEFAEVQNKLIDIKREHDNLRMTYPARWFVGRREELKITIVTSDKTEDVFKTGKDNDVKVFN